MIEYRLKLFITGNTARSTQAVANLQRICETILPGRVEVEIVDVLEDPQQAEGERILATPTLIKKAPMPMRRIIGDLSDTARVLQGLDLVGMFPRK